MPASKPNRIPSSERLRRAALLLPFALVLLIPKVLGLSRRRKLWTGLRAAAALLGLLLLARGAASDFSWPGVLAGSVLILAAAGARSGSPPVRKMDEFRQALGGLITLNGGTFTPPGGRPQRVHLVVGSSKLHVVDSEGEPLADLSLEALTSLRVEPVRDAWHLVLLSESRETIFRYQGSFGEHLARVAAATLRNLRQSS